MSIAVNPDQALIDAVCTIGREVAAAHADDVDARARFPEETIAALKEQRALSAFVPAELGGAGASFETIARCCLELGRYCGASAMVFAMHQIQLAAIVRHLDGESWFGQYLRDLAAEQRLIASVTSEIGTGGDIGRSIAPLTDNGDGTMSFEKQAPTVSYGAYADDLLTTLRRGPETEPGDQVIVLSSAGQTSLEQTGTWDVLGMRGTCSPGYIVRATVPPEQVLGAPCARVLAETMVPASHILWSQLWLGICENAFDRARAFVRAAAKRNAGTPIPAALRLSHLMSELQMLRAEVQSGVEGFPRRVCGSRARTPADDGCSAALQQPEDRGIRASGRDLPWRAGCLRNSRIQERQPVQCRAPSARQHVGQPDDRQRTDPRDQRRPTADRQGRLMPEFRPGSPEQVSFLDSLADAGLVARTGVHGLYARGGTFERVRLAFDALVTRAAAPESPEPLYFPPLLPREQLERNGYLGSFPHLAGTVFGFDGDEDAAAAQLRARDQARGLERLSDDDRDGAHARRVLSALSGDRGAWSRYLRAASRLTPAMPTCFGVSPRAIPRACRSSTCGRSCAWRRPRR